jgi:hypothetical protein
MSLETIRDRQGKPIGTVETQPNGSAVAKKVAGPVVGYYDAKTDQVREAGGPVIGRGKGMLYSLLHD